MASAFEKVESGAFSSIAIERWVSSVSMPAMSPSGSGRFAYSSAPRTPAKNPVAADPSARSRLTVCSKSEAFTGVPSEYFSPSLSRRR